MVNACFFVGEGQLAEPAMPEPATSAAFLPACHLLLLLQQHLQQPGAAAWHPGAAASRGRWSAAAAAGPHRPAALWAAACLAGCAAFGYGAFWASYAQRRAAAVDAGASGSGGEGAETRLRDPSPMRRKLLHILLEDKRQAAAAAAASTGAAAGAAGAAGAARPAPGGRKGKAGAASQQRGEP